MGKLKNIKHERFCLAYIGEAKFIASKAAVIAGYSEKSSRDAGSRLLTNVDIRARINELLEVQGITPEHITSALAEIAFTDPLSVVDPNTGRVKENGNTMLVKSVSVGGKFGDKVELYDRMAALKELMSILGMKSLGTVNVNKKNDDGTEEVSKKNVTPLIVLNGISMDDI